MSRQNKVKYLATIFLLTKAFKAKKMNKGAVIIDLLDFRYFQVLVAKESIIKFFKKDQNFSMISIDPFYYHLLKH